MQSRQGESRLKLTYLEHTIAGYEDFADIILVVADLHLPVHSQLLARESRVMANLLRDLAEPPTWRSPFVADQEMLRGCEPEDVIIFLTVLYRGAGAATSPASVAEACAVYRLADFFDAPHLLDLSCKYLRKPAKDLLSPSMCEDGPVKWLLVADRLRMQEFSRSCISFIAEHFDKLWEDPRLKELSAACLFELLLKVHHHGQLHLYKTSYTGRPRDNLLWGPRASYSGRME
ncbi:hypothetical protein WJX84_006978 [Apatococcus fuscideae]|uniref:BTB domain-containing protein n=1 Tax=Apatococcus fuscideae TaxID=2026836 RepID=A0AAW1SXI7_9CHLO